MLYNEETFYAPNSCFCCYMLLFKRFSMITETDVVKNDVSQLTVKEKFPIKTYVLNRVYVCMCVFTYTS